MGAEERKWDVMSVASYRSHMHSHANFNQGSNVRAFQGKSIVPHARVFQPGGPGGAQQKRGFVERDRVQFKGSEWDVTAVKGDMLMLQNDEKQEYVAKAQYHQLRLI